MSVVNVIPMVFWTRYLLEDQGYKIDGSGVLQDNKISIMLDNNGGTSSSKRTRHINISFFVADQVNAVEVSIKKFPKYDMVGD